MQLTVNKLIELSGADIVFYEWSSKTNRYSKIFVWNNFLGTINKTFVQQSIGNRAVNRLSIENDALSAYIGSDTYEDPRKEYLETKVQKLEGLLDEMEKILEIRKKI